MGTNYYWHPAPRCPECGREREALHIGKSSAGWVFSLHVIPETGLLGLKEWFDLILSKKEGFIVNEYGDVVSPSAMYQVITNRYGKLKRHEIDGSFCIGHGDGTYDLVVGCFS